MTKRTTNYLLALGATLAVAVSGNSLVVRWKTAEAVSNQELCSKNLDYIWSLGVQHAVTHGADWTNRVARADLEGLDFEVGAMACPINQAPYDLSFQLNVGPACPNQRVHQAQQPPPALLERLRRFDKLGKLRLTLKQD